MEFTHLDVGQLEYIFLVELNKQLNVFDSVQLLLDLV